MYKSEEMEILTAVRLGVNKIVTIGATPLLLSSRMLEKWGINVDNKPTDVRVEDSISKITYKIRKLITSIRDDEGYDPIILLPKDQKFCIAMYISACMEKTKILSVEELGGENKIIDVPLFPFVKLKGNESFVLSLLTHQRDVGIDRVPTKNLLSDIEKNDYYHMLYTSGRGQGGMDSGSAYRQLLRILDNLMELSLVERYGHGRSITWELTELADIFMS